MADNTTGIVILDELDPPRELKLGHKALKIFCARTKLGVNEIAQVVERYDIMALLINVMLQVRYPDLQEDQIDSMLDPLPIETIIHKASEAIKAAFPSAGKQADSEADDPFDGTTSRPA